MENAAPTKVFFAGENGGVKTALDLAAQAGTVKLVTAMAEADALGLDGVIPPGAAERAQAGTGVVLILGAGVTRCMPVFFFCALAGGWDQAGLDKSDEASRMTGFLRPVVNFIFIAPNRWGAKISPLHSRFPITMRPAARAEARALTEERVRLVNGSR